MPGLEFTTKAWMAIADDLSLRWGVFDFLVLVVYRATARCEGDCILQQLYRKQEVDWPWPGPGLGSSRAARSRSTNHDVENHWLTSPIRATTAGASTWWARCGDRAGPAC